MTPVSVWCSRTAEITRAPRPALLPDIFTDLSAATDGLADSCTRREEPEAVAAEAETRIATAEEVTAAIVIGTGVVR
jgi:hypothetical protein